MQYVIYFLIAIGATTVGSLTGMGGGVIIKPLMDVLHDFDVQTIGVISSLTVFSMSVVSIGKQMLAKTRIPFGTAIPLALGWLVKSIFFMKIGFGKDYREGLKEGFQTLSRQKKVPFRLRHLGNYIKIELELIAHTFAYAKDWFSRKLGHK